MSSLSQRITDLATRVGQEIKSVWAALNGKEPSFSKNTGFNKAFGTMSGTVSEGNHAHSGVYATAGHDHSGVYEPADSTIVKTASTQTLTNKRVTLRVGSTTSSATPTINTNDYDAYSITALAVAITSMTTNLSGAPTDFQSLLLRIKDNGTARAIVWGTGFQNGAATLPATTVAGKTLLIGLFWDAVDNKWTCDSAGSRA
jgi:hypothetical protein